MEKQKLQESNKNHKNEIRVLSLYILDYIG